MRQKQSLAHTSLLVLSLLSRQDMYGYQMIATLEQRLDPAFSMKEGTLYPILRELENAGAVSCYEQEVSGRTRKYYHLTRKGRRQLAEEQEQWERYEHAINAVLHMA